ncbi:hypothetical protein D3C73_708660 [compost metagenome]
MEPSHRKQQPVTLRIIFAMKAVALALLIKLLVNGRLGSFEHFLDRYKQSALAGFCISNI